jgi:D-3-phosphoglycerate dehydrogenase / 2-oxoglutarate reductase
MKPNILITECSEFGADALDRLRQVGNPILADLDRDDLLLAVCDADILWVRLRHRIDAEIMAVAPQLRLIATPTTGLNHIDLKAAENLGVGVLSLRGETEFLKEIPATAELTVALMLTLLRHVPAAVNDVDGGGWNRDSFKGRDLHGKTVGIVGFGRLGQMVARLLKPFGVRLLATDRHAEANPSDADCLRLPFVQLLREADIVSLHVNLCPETTGFFGTEQFAQMKKGAWFINTARGELVDETALLDALRSGQLAGAALDVLRNESSAGMGNHPLVIHARENPNVIITPHIGGCTKESMEKTELFLAEKLCAYLHETSENHARACEQG